MNSRMRHVGIIYERIRNGCKLRQTEFALATGPVETPKGASGDAKLMASQTTALREAAGALLFLCCARVDILAGVAILRQRACSAEIIRLRMANAVARRA